MGSSRTHPRHPSHTPSPSTSKSPSHSRSTSHARIHAPSDSQLPNAVQISIHEDDTTATSMTSRSRSHHTPTRTTSPSTSQIQRGGSHPVSQPPHDAVVVHIQVAPVEPQQAQAQRDETSSRVMTTDDVNVQVDEEEQNEDEEDDEEEEDEEEEDEDEDEDEDGDGEQEEDGEEDEQADKDADADGVDQHENAFESKHASQDENKGEDEDEYEEEDDSQDGVEDDDDDDDDAGVELAVLHNEERDDNPSQHDPLPRPPNRSVSLKPKKRTVTTQEPMTVNERTNRRMTSPRKKKKVRMGRVARNKRVLSTSTLAVPLTSTSTSTTLKSSRCWLCARKLLNPWTLIPIVITIVIVVTVTLVVINQQRSTGDSSCFPVYTYDPLNGLGPNPWQCPPGKDPFILPDGHKYYAGVLFRVWAPHADAVHLHINSTFSRGIVRQNVTLPEVNTSNATIINTTMGNVTMGNGTDSGNGTNTLKGVIHLTTAVVGMLTSLVSRFTSLSSSTSTTTSHHYSTQQSFPDLSIKPQATTPSTNYNAYALINGRAVFIMSPESRGMWSISIGGVIPGDTYTYIISSQNQTFIRLDPVARDVTYTLDGNNARIPGSIWDRSAVHETYFDWIHGTHEWISLSTNTVPLPPLPISWNTPPIIHVLPPISQMIIYQIHIPSFSMYPTSSISPLDSAITQLDYLRNLGITMIQLLPIMETATSGWRYDMGLPYVVASALGGHLALKRFVFHCHTRGLGVLLDVKWSTLSKIVALANYDTNSTTSQGIFFDGNAMRPAFSSPIVASYITSWFSSLMDEYGIDGFHLIDVDGMRYHMNTTIVDMNGVRVIQQINTLVNKRGGLMIASNQQGTFSNLSFPSIDASLIDVYGFHAQWDPSLYHTLVRDSLPYTLNASTSTSIPTSLLTQTSDLRRIIYVENDHTYATYGRLSTRYDPVNASSTIAQKRSLLALAMTLMIPGGIPQLYMGSEWGCPQQSSLPITSPPNMDWSTLGSYNITSNTFTSYGTHYQLYNMTRILIGMRKEQQDRNNDDVEAVVTYHQQQQVARNETKQVIVFSHGSFLIIANLGPHAYPYSNISITHNTTITIWKNETIITNHTDALDMDSTGESSSSSSTGISSNVTGGNDFNITSTGSMDGNVTSQSSTGMDGNDTDVSSISGGTSHTTNITTISSSAGITNHTNVSNTSTPSNNIISSTGSNIPSPTFTNTTQLIPYNITWSNTSWLVSGYAIELPPSLLSRIPSWELLFYTHDISSSVASNVTRYHAVNGTLYIPLADYSLVILQPVYVT